MYPAKLSFGYEGEIKTFQDIQKLRGFSTMRSNTGNTETGQLTQNKMTKKYITMSKATSRQIEAE